MSDRDIRDLTEAVGILTATLDAAQARADAIVRWQVWLAEPAYHPDESTQGHPDGYEPAGPWEPVSGSAAHILWRRPLRRVE